MPQLRVCVIGAGAAGLAAARHLTSELDVFDVRVFEKASRVGGTWVYSENTGIDGRGIPVHSSLYRNLRYSVSFLLIDTKCSVFWYHQGHPTSIFGKYLFGRRFEI